MDNFEIIPLIISTNYISKIILDLLLMIIASLTLPDILVLAKVSKYFKWHIDKLIPPHPITISKFITSVQAINYLDKIEECNTMYKKLPHLSEKELGRIIPRYCDYHLGLLKLNKLSKIMSYSPHFVFNKGNERIYKLCGKLPSKSKSYCFSCFRDPYTILLIVTLMLLLTVTLSWFIYANITFNLNEKEITEKAIYQNEYNKNIKYIQENGYTDWTVPFDSIFFIGRSSLERKMECSGGPRKSGCYSHVRNWQETMLCLKSQEELCGLHNLSNLTFKYFEFAYEYFNGTYSMTEIKKIYKMLSDYGCSDYGSIFRRGPMVYVDLGYLKKNVNTYYDIFTLSSDVPWVHCIGINNDTYVNTDRFDRAFGFYVDKITYNAICLAECITPHPNLYKNIWHLILMLCLLWLLFIILIFCCVYQ